MSTNTKPTGRFRQQSLDFQKKSIFTDVTIFLGRKEFSAHSSVLSAVSPVFAKIFTSECQEETTRVVKMEDVDAATLEVFLNYCYLGEISKGGDVWELLMLFDKYEVELTDEGFQEIKGCMNVHNVLDYLIAGDLFGKVNLQKVVTYLKDNVKEVLKVIAQETNAKKINELLRALSRHVEPSGYLLCGKVTDTVQWSISSRQTVPASSSTILIPYNNTMISLALTYTEGYIHYPICTNTLKATINSEVSISQLLTLKFIIKVHQEEPKESIEIVSFTRASPSATVYTYLEKSRQQWRGNVLVTVCQSSSKPSSAHCSPLKVDESFSDASIVVQTETFPVHKFVLANRSKYFASLFKEKLETHKLEDISSKTFVILRDYMYSCEWPHRDSVDVDVLEGACILELQELIDHSQYVLCSKIDHENCVQYLLVALKWDLNLLKEHSIKYVVGNLREVYNSSNWSSLVDNYPEILKDLCSRTLQYRDDIIQCSATNTSPVVHSLCQQLHNFQKQSIGTDITFAIGSQHLTAHRLVLSAVSPVFTKMFTSGMTEERMGVVQIEDVDAATLEAFLNYCYLGEITKVGDVQQLLMLFDKYDVELTDEGIQQMEECVNVHNVLDYLIAGDLFGKVNLQKVVTFLRANVKEVLKIIAQETNLDEVDRIVRALSRHVEPSRHLLCGKVTDTVQWRVSSGQSVPKPTSPSTILIPYNNSMISVYLEVHRSNIHRQLYPYLSEKHIHHIKLRASIMNKLPVSNYVSLKCMVYLIKNESNEKIEIGSFNKGFLSATVETSVSVPKDLVYGQICVTVCQSTRIQSTVHLSPLKVDESFTDVSIVVQSETFPVHKFVLANRSKYFASLFNEKLETYKLEDISSKSFVILRDYMYSCEWPLRDSVDVDVLEGACTLELQELINHSQYVLCSKIDHENCVRFLEVALKWDLELLKEHSIKYAVDNLQHFHKSVLWSSLMEDYPEILRDICNRWLNVL